MSDYKIMNAQLEALSESSRNYIPLLSNASALIYENMKDLNWAGFYLVRNDALLLGPFQGKVACVNIAKGKGVCGTAYATEVNTGVHGVGASKHLSGEAVDIHLPDMETGRAYYCFILHNIDFDQLIFEHRRDGAVWLHCSVLLDSRENRHQAFPNYRVR